MGFSIGIPLGKPHKHLHSTNPFTKVSGNLRINVNSIRFLLPSALADGNAGFPLNWALATFFNLYSSSA